MLIQPQCLPCILNMSLSAIQRAVIRPDEIREIFETVLEVPALGGKCWDVTSAEVVEQVLIKIAAYSGNTDPFRGDKAKQNRRMSEIYPILEQRIASSGNPLVAALKYAVLGNAIDAMVTALPTDKIEEVLADAGKMHFDQGDLAHFIDKLQHSKTVLYLGDNAGEVVLDKLFIAALRREYNLKIFYVVRSRPALNDVTMEDAAFTDMSDVAHVMENGIDGPLPGTVMRRCSQKLQKLFYRSDLIISKGGGNFETLSEYDGLNNDITFMLLSKCSIYCDYFSVPLNRPIFANVFGRRSIFTGNFANGGS